MHKDTKKEIKASALKYDERMIAPLILYNGRANLAQAMLDIAKEKNIPIVYEPETQEILSLYNEGDYVPAETFEVLAKIFAFVRGQFESTSKNQ